MDPTKIILVWKFGFSFFQIWCFCDTIVLLFGDFPLSSWCSWWGTAPPRVRCAVVVARSILVASLTMIRSSRYFFAEKEFTLNNYERKLLRNFFLGPVDQKYLQKMPINLSCWWKKFGTRAVPVFFTNLWIPSWDLRNFYLNRWPSDFWSFPVDTWLPVQGEWLGFVSFKTFKS